jgi:hypothetical protein
VSSPVYDVGSVIDFWPDPADPSRGTALVVIQRDMWVMHTELRRVVLVEGRYIWPSLQDI